MERTGPHPTRAPQDRQDALVTQARKATPARPPTPEPLARRASLEILALQGAQALLAEQGIRANKDAGGFRPSQKWVLEALEVPEECEVRRETRDSVVKMVYRAAAGSRVRWRSQSIQ